MKWYLSNCLHEKLCRQRELLQHNPSLEEQYKTLGMEEIVQLYDSKVDEICRFGNMWWEIVGRNASRVSATIYLPKNEFRSIFDAINQAIVEYGFVDIKSIDSISYFDKEKF